MSQNMNQFNKLYNHFKNESSSDSEEEEMFGPNKKMKTNDQFTEDNESSLQFDKNTFKPSKSLQIIDNCQQKSRKRFSIWSDILLEEELSRNVNNSMSIKNNSFQNKSNKIDRNSENYSFWIKKQLENKTSSQKSSETNPNQLEIGNNSKDNDNSNDLAKNSRKRKKKNKKKRKEKRDIPLEIATKLNEPKVDLIRRVFDTIGESKTRELCSATMNIESAGGLMTADGSRRRSAGGVFFQLLRNDPKITKESIDYIFFSEQQDFKRRKRIVKRAKRKLLNNLNKSLMHSLTVTDNKVESNSPQSMAHEDNQAKGSTAPSETITTCN